MEKTYQKFEKMIHSHALKTAQKFPSICAEELFSEGNFIFLRAVESHDEDRGSLSTWLFQKLRGGMMDYALKHSKERGREAGELVMEPEDCSREVCDILHRFGEDAKEVVSIALHTPEDLTRGLLREILKDMGWSCWKIRHAFAEIRNVL